MLALRAPRTQYALALVSRRLCSLPPLTTTESGLMYRDVYVPDTTSDTMRAKAGLPVSVHYTGRLEGGTVFDSSFESAPIEFTLGKREVIRGWEEGIVGMVVGGRRQLVIPPHLGYGARGAPPAIVCAPPE